MEQIFFEELHAEGLISEESFGKINNKPIPLFSIHWEVKTLIFLGVALLTSGLGILVYKNIDTIGHQAILAFIALVCGGCLFYCFKNKLPYSDGRVLSPTTFFDYILLLGSVCLLTFIAYIQYQYNIFGNHYGMATFIPMVILFYIAYAFDNAGILAMAIVNLGLWMGVTATPKQLLLRYTFDSETIIFTYLGFGLLLLAAGWVTGKFSIKPHFKFSYYHYGIHVSLISLLAGYFFNYEAGAISILWLFAEFILAYFIYNDAYKSRSFYFLVIVILYSYIAVSSLVMRMLIGADSEDLKMYTILIYYILSALGLVQLFVNLNKKRKVA